jgi:hypothetical protein
MPNTSCARCGRQKNWEAFGNPHCAACRDAAALARWLQDLLRELGQLAQWDAQAAALTGRELTKARRALDGPRRRLEEWLQLAAKTLESRRVGGPLVPRLRVAPLVAARLHEVVDTLKFVIRDLETPR